MILLVDSLSNQQKNMYLFVLCWRVWTKIILVTLEVELLANIINIRHLCLLWLLYGSRKNTNLKYLRLRIIWNLNGPSQQKLSFSMLYSSVYLLMCDRSKFLEAFSTKIIPKHFKICQKESIWQIISGKEWGIWIVN